VQNQFNAVGSAGTGFLKPGIVRRITADVVLRGASFAVRHVYNHANLAGVKTIHSARWVFIDDRRRRLIFASNYDGSLEAYNDDFVDKVWWGLNAVFSDGTGFPGTRSGYGHLHEARFLLLAIDDPARAGAWLGRIAGELTTCTGRSPGGAVSVALAASGLAKLGLAPRSAGSRTASWTG
jgi:hypothetical protein